MPQTLDIRAEEIHVVLKVSAKEIGMLRTAMGMCEGGPGKSPEEQTAWEYFKDNFWSYIAEMDKKLNDR